MPGSIIEDQKPSRLSAGPDSYPLRTWRSLMMPWDWIGIVTIRSDTR
jgi:hypothetical protein